MEIGDKLAFKWDKTYFVDYSGIIRKLVQIYLPSVVGLWWCFCPPDHRREGKSHLQPWQYLSATPSAGSEGLCPSKLPLWTWSALCVNEIQSDPDLRGPEIIPERFWMEEVCLSQGRKYCAFASFHPDWYERYLEPRVFIYVSAFNPCIFCVSLYSACMCTEIFRNSMKVSPQDHCVEFFCPQTALTVSVRPPADPSGGNQMTCCPSRGIPVLLHQESRAKETRHATVTVSFLKGSFHFNFPLTNRLSNRISAIGEN